MDYVLKESWSFSECERYAHADDVESGCRQIGRGQHLSAKGPRGGAEPHPEIFAERTSTVA